MAGSVAYGGKVCKLTKGENRMTNQAYNEEKKHQGKPSRDRKQQRENKRQF
jgi:hypothetical protein